MQVMEVTKEDGVGPRLDYVSFYIAIFLTK